MSFYSVNTNVGAMLALQTLNAINAELFETQRRITTGLRVASPKDDPAVWAIAQMQRSESRGLDQVMLSLKRGQSVVDVAIMAGEEISDLMLQMKDKAVAAMDFPDGSAERTALNDDYLALRRRIDLVATNAAFGGVNLISGGGTNRVRALANTRVSATIDVDHVDLSTTGAALGGIRADLTGPITSADLDALSAGLQNVSTAVGRLGTGYKSLQIHHDFVAKQKDATDAAIGRLVDADLARESARWQALQVRRQLAIHALALANAAPSMLLRLFQ